MAEIYGLLNGRYISACGTVDNFFFFLIKAWRLHKQAE